MRRWLEGGTPPTEGCTARALRIVGERIYVACGLGGLWTIESADAEFVVLERRDLGGTVTGLFEQSGQLWAVVERVEARPILDLGTDPLSRRGPVMPAPMEGEASPRPRATFPEDRGPSTPLKLLPNEQNRPAPPPAVVDLSARTEGRVLRVLGREVMIDLGTDQDVRPGTRVEFLTGSSFSEHRGSDHDSSKDASRNEDPNDFPFSQLAVGVVRSATTERALVRLGVNEQVPVGSIVRPTNAPVTASSSSPARVSEFWEVSALIRPFMAIDDLGGGLLLDAAAGYRFKSGLHLELALQPLGLASADAGNVSTITAFLMVNYDTRSFEIGGGLGAQTVNEPEFYEATGSGTVMPQHLRLGALDGVNLDIVSTAVLFRRSFRFSGLRGSLQIPLSDGGWFMLFRGGGGVSGYAFGEIAVRSLASGNGGPGSTFVVGSLGGVGVFEQASCGIELCSESISYAGPTIGMGVEHRF